MMKVDVVKDQYMQLFTSVLISNFSKYLKMIKVMELICFAVEELYQESMLA